MAKVITISVDEKVEESFRKVARRRFGMRKGTLSRAFTDAMKKWIADDKYDPDSHALMLLKEGFNLGGLREKDRAKWHER